MLVLLLACTVTDELGNACPWEEALSDGIQQWCPQDDAPEVCTELSVEVAQFESQCLDSKVRRDILELEIAANLDCPSALVILPGFNACISALQARPCPDAQALPSECEGVVIGG